MVKWSGRLPQLQSHRVEKRPSEIVQRLQKVAGATDAPLSCGEGIPYTHAVVFTVNTLTKRLFPNVIFHSGVCVCLCDLLWDLKEDDDTK